jgi:hypothetical protein
VFRRSMVTAATIALAVDGTFGSPIVGSRGFTCDGRYVQTGVVTPFYTFSPQPLQGQPLLRERLAAAATAVASSHPAAVRR